MYEKEPYKAYLGQHNSIGDKEILADLLGDTKTDRYLAEVVDFITRKEQAKMEQGTVSCESTNAVRQ
jgi:hypothetical protein